MNDNDLDKTIREYAARAIEILIVIIIICVINLLVSK